MKIVGDGRFPYPAAIFQLEDLAMFQVKPTHCARTIGLVIAGGLAGAIQIIADDGNGLQRLSAEYQNNATVGGDGEVSTTAPALPGGTGGTVVYDKTVSVRGDVDVIYVTFSAQADVHNGTALLMNATVNGVLIQPLLGQTAAGGGGPHVQTGWYTLLILPNSASTNCNDGTGGPADCHDNAITFSGCARIPSRHGDDKAAPVNVKIKLADLPGGGTNRAFYERATIYIDGQQDEKGTLCRGVGTTPH
jgi:hypothetical protein